MLSTSLALFLQVILLLGSALLAYKLYRSGLYRSYPVFFAYFVFRIPNSIWPLVVDTSSPVYQKLWICTDPLFGVLYILLVRELYRLVLAKYRGIYTLGRWAMYLAMAIAVIISGLSLIPKINPSSPQVSKIMFYVIAIERGINTALVIFIVVLLLFLSRYPIRLSRNVRIHAVIYSMFFLGNTFVLLMRTLLGLHLANAFNDAHLVVTAACLVAWLVLLTPEGAETRSAPATLDPQYEHRLLTQLDSLNVALLKVGHREGVIR